MKAAIRPGARVSVQRVSGERVDGYIQQGPIGYLRHIGEFYLVGQLLDDPATRGRGRPRKEGEPPRRKRGREIGMYERRDIRVIPGRPVDC